MPRLYHRAVPAGGGNSTSGAPTLRAIDVREESGNVGDLGTILPFPLKTQTGLGQPIGGVAASGVHNAFCEHCLDPTEGWRLDACICLIVGFHLAEGKECLVVGNQRTGFIVVPHDARLRSELEVRCRRTGRIPTKWVQAVRWSSG
jgi:hypothetical protein